MKLGEFVKVEVLSDFRLVQPFPGPCIELLRLESEPRVIYI